MNRHIPNEWTKKCHVYVHVLKMKANLNNNQSLK